jgi:hypothetical protein
MRSFDLLFEALNLVVPGFELFLRRLLKMPREFFEKLPG